MKVDESGKSRFKGMKEEESRCKQKKGDKRGMKVNESG